MPSLQGCPRQTSSIQCQHGLPVDSDTVIPVQGVAKDNGNICSCILGKELPALVTHDSMLRADTGYEWSAGNITGAR